MIVDSGSSILQGLIPAVCRFNLEMSLNVLWHPAHWYLGGAGGPCRLLMCAARRDFTCVLYPQPSWPQWCCLRFSFLSFFTFTVRCLDTTWRSLLKSLLKVFPHLGHEKFFNEVSINETDTRAEFIFILFTSPSLNGCTVVIDKCLDTRDQTIW